MLWGLSALNLRSTICSVCKWLSQYVSQAPQIPDDGWWSHFHSASQMSVLVPMRQSTSSHSWLTHINAGLFDMLYWLFVHVFTLSWNSLPFICMFSLEAFLKFPWLLINFSHRNYQFLVLLGVFSWTTRKVVGNHSEFAVSVNYQNMHQQYLAPDLIVILIAIT